MVAVLLLLLLSVLAAFVVTRWITGKGFGALGGQGTKESLSVESVGERKERLTGFIPFKHWQVPQSLVVDCTHPKADQITHHKEQSVPEEIKRTMMSSSDGVLTALKLNHELIRKHDCISTNHFDIDSFVSVWCFLNRDEALRYERLLREVARIGDFRELRLDGPMQHKALKLCCWLNSVEKRRFYEPFGSAMEKDDSLEKFDYFLPRFKAVLEDVEFVREEWSAAYERVVSDYAVVNNIDAESLLIDGGNSGARKSANGDGANSDINEDVGIDDKEKKGETKPSKGDEKREKEGGEEKGVDEKEKKACTVTTRPKMRGKSEEEEVKKDHKEKQKGGVGDGEARVTQYPGIDLVMVSCPHPVHYYALFSVGRGFDIVVSLYSQNRYELEQKYTTYVDINRPVLPRLALQPLVRVLNSHEENAEGCVWHASSFADSGPLLRIDPLLDDDDDDDGNGGTDENGDEDDAGDSKHTSPQKQKQQQRQLGGGMQKRTGAVKKLTKAQRYGHPNERPIYSSSINPSLFRTIILSFFRWSYSCNHGLRKYRSEFIDDPVAKCDAAADTKMNAASTDVKAADKGKEIDEQQQQQQQQHRVLSESVSSTRRRSRSISRRSSSRGPLPIEAAASSAASVPGRDNNSHHHHHHHRRRRRRISPSPSSSSPSARLGSAAGNVVGTITTTTTPSPGPSLRSPRSASFSTPKTNNDNSNNPSPFTPSMGGGRRGGGGARLSRDMSSGSLLGDRFHLLSSSSSSLRLELDTASSSATNTATSTPTGGGGMRRGFFFPAAEAAAAGGGGGGGGGEGEESSSSSDGEDSYDDELEALHEEADRFRIKRTRRRRRRRRRRRGRGRGRSSKSRSSTPSNGASSITPTRDNRSFSELSFGSASSNITDISSIIIREYDDGDDDDDDDDDDGRFDDEDGSSCGSSSSSSSPGLWSVLQKGRYNVMQKRERWSWKQIRYFNKCLDWETWERGLAHMDNAIWDAVNMALPSPSSSNDKEGAEQPNAIDTANKSGGGDDDVVALLSELDNEEEDGKAAAGSIPPPPPFFPPPPLGDGGVPPPPPGVLPPPPMLLAGGGCGMEGKTMIRQNPNGEPSTELKRLHWIPVRSDTKGGLPESCIWADMEEDLQLDVSEISRRFSSKLPRKKKKKKNKKKGSGAMNKFGGGAGNVALLDPKREMNISIALSGMRMMVEDISEAILNVDLSILTIERLPQLQSLLPSEEEAKIVARYSGEPSSLTLASRLHYLVLLPPQDGRKQQAPTRKGRGVKYLATVEALRKEIISRINHVAFIHNLPEKLRKVHRDLTHFNGAISTLRDSQRIRDIVRTTLTLGNFMNYSLNARGKGYTAGFGVEILTKLHLSKATDRKSSLLDFVASVCLKRFPSTCSVQEQLAVELRHVIKAAKIDSEHALGELARVKRELKVMGENLRQIAVAAKRARLTGQRSLSFNDGAITGKGDDNDQNDVSSSGILHGVMAARFYKALSKRFMKCARVHDSLQKNVRLTNSQFQALLKFWGEEIPGGGAHFKKMEGFFEIFAEFAPIWDDVVARTRQRAAQQQQQQEGERIKSLLSPSKKTNYANNSKSDRGALRRRTVSAM